MYYLEVSIDGEACEVAFEPMWAYIKCPRCAQPIYGAISPCLSSEELEKTKDYVVSLCPNCGRENADQKKEIKKLLKWGVKEVFLRTGKLITEEELLNY